MKAHYQGERGIRVIRPFVYTRETDTRDFARAHGLPVVNENCPACFEQPKVGGLGYIGGSSWLWHTRNRPIIPATHAPNPSTPTYTKLTTPPTYNKLQPPNHQQERARIKKMLAKEESLIPRMFTNLRRGITPLLDDGIYAVIQVGF